VRGRQSTGAARRLDIQGLRALAVVLVVVFHTGVALPGGFTGVDVFFAISGFVITSTLVHELERTGRISLRGFYLRRVKRLLPALAVVVSFVAVIGTLATPAAATRISAMTGLFASFFAANIYLNGLSTGYFSVSTRLDPLLHTWTLAVEEQFYLVFPALLLGAWVLGSRRGRGRMTAVLVIAAAAEASLFFATHTVDATGAGLAYYGSPARAWEFAAGSLVALAAHFCARVPARLAAALVPVGAAGVVAVALAVTQETPLLVSEVVPVASTALLLAAGCRANPVSRLLGLRPFAWLGDLSYSLYLWHWPLIVFARALAPSVGWAAPAAGAAALLPAWLSYRYVENPIRHNHGIRGRRALALVAACTFVPAVFALETSVVPSYSVPSFDLAYHEDVARGCEQWTPYGSPARSRCVWRVPHARGDVVLIGDSNAGHFTEPFVASARAAGYDATVAAPSGCPFVQVELTSKGRDYDACNAFNREALPALVAQRPSLVVISSRVDEWLAGSAFTLRAPDGTIARDPASKAGLWRHALRAEIRRLNRGGIPVVVIEPVPYMTHPVTDCAVILIMTHACGASTPRTRADQELQPALAVEQAAAAGQRAWVVSFEKQLCTRDRCMSRRGDLILYRDLDHLSIRGAETLTRSFAAEVIPHARGFGSSARTDGRRYALRWDGGGG